ncbi:hypothetical protein CFC21_044528 [Triticum aestivum]|uniref:KIB1-4 beta-propeller domain-containing protein n=2 Tax=Triticum aestivum TaxID=4565 RepID=A0A9R1FRW5_WHEAT|nr:hypothetical protein CFC21_044528 [Triticum aestivum]
MGLLSSILQWCLLMPKFLVLMVANLPDPANCARCRALYHPWHSAVRHHGPQARPLPWIALRDSFVVASYNGHMHRLPENAMTAGSTNDWLALGLGQKHTDEEQAEYYVVRNYVLHNPFSYRSLPLPELDVVVQEWSLVRKFLMRSTVDDFMAVITNNRKHPLILFQRGKGVWTPRPWATQYTYLIDIAFHGDKLYAITTAEDLIPIDLASDGEGRPMVAMGPRIIKKSINYDHYESLTTSDEEDDDENEEDGEEEDNDDEKKEEEEDNDLTYINCSAEFAPDVKPDNITIISRHLIESHGKLLMVRHSRQLHPQALWVTLKVDVLEADFSTHEWVPLTGGLGGDRALFVSMAFSKSVPAPCGQVEEDAIYFMDTSEVFNMKSGTSMPSKFYNGVTWLFPPEYQL